MRMARIGYVGIELVGVGGYMGMMVGRRVATVSDLVCRDIDGSLTRSAVRAFKGLPAVAPTDAQQIFIKESSFLLTVRFYFIR
jgi:hypothetical protein